MFRSFSIRNYRLYATGEFISLIGIWMQFVAQDWLVLQLSGNSGTALGLVAALQFLPITLLALYGGKLADRYDKRRMLIAANVIWGVLAATLAVLVLTGGVRLWHIYVLATLFGTVNAIEMPVRQSFVGELVRTDLLPNALSLSSATFNSARIVGPAVAGLGIAWFDVGPVFAVNVLTYVAPVVTLMMMRPADLHRSAKPAQHGGIVDGLRYVRERFDLVLPIAMVGVVAMLGYNFQLTLAVMSKTVFDRGAASFGVLTSMLAVGALCGALMGARRKSRPSANVVLGGALAFGVLETLLAFSPTYLTMTLLLFPTGFAMIYFAQACNQRVQMGVASEYRGRVMALYSLVFAGTVPIGATVIGWLAEHVSVRSSIYVGGLASIVVAVAGALVMLRRTDTPIAVVIPMAINMGSTSLPVNTVRRLRLAWGRNRAPHRGTRRRPNGLGDIARPATQEGLARRRPSQVSGRRKRQPSRPH
ncbi:MAG: MFS transporter [Longispora sp.]|nr:MFS transporter [Longispora sp. (in: high G+C Gram-positive bacteria)]